VEYFFYCRDQPGSETLRTELAEAHWSFMDRYADAMIARGPTLTADRTAATGSMHMVDLPDAEAVRVFAFEEPYYRAGVYGDVLVRRWRNALARTMWQFKGDAVNNRRYLIIGHGKPGMGPNRDALLEQRQQQVLGADAVVTEAGGLQPGLVDRLLGTLGDAHRLPPGAGRGPAVLAGERDRGGDQVAVVAGGRAVGQDEGVLQADADVVAEVERPRQHGPGRPLAAVVEARRGHAGLVEQRVDRGREAHLLAVAGAVNLDQQPLGPGSQAAGDQQLGVFDAGQPRLDADAARQQLLAELGRAHLGEVDRGEVGQDPPRAHQVEPPRRVGLDPRPGGDADADARAGLAHGRQHRRLGVGVHRLRAVAAPRVDVDQRRAGVDGRTRLERELLRPHRKRRVVGGRPGAVDARLDDHARIHAVRVS
jgi:uncharacterized protein YciI